MNSLFLARAVRWHAGLAKAMRCATVITTRTMAVVLLLAAGQASAAVEGAVPLPAPKYPVRTEQGVRVPMRDGVRLATDLYLPDGAGKRLPVILIRTQYGKARYRPADGPGVPRMFAGQGFVVAIQDIRGRFESEGHYTLAESDAADGYDTVDWLARQPWSNGKVGTYGCSSLGITQVFLAQRRHPALAAMVPQAPGGATRNQLWDVVTGGVPEIGWSLGWFHQDGNKKPFDKLMPDGGPPEIDEAAILETLPVSRMAELAGGPPSDWVDYVTRKPGDPWWDRFGYFDERSRVDVPALFVNSWNDMSVGETLHLFERFRRDGLSRRARENAFAIISPTAHCESELVGPNLTIDGRDLGDARKDFWAIYLGWFDHWLRGRAGDYEAMPRVQYYVMGANEWRSAEQWPPKGTRRVPYYLHSAGRANSRHGDGTLSTTPPGDEPADQFVYDPAAPVPSRDMVFPGDRYEQGDIEARDDVLVYTTPPLAEGLEVTGPVEVRLFVSSSARDTDFTANLVDVYPDGRAFHIRSGILRARYREGLAREVWMEEGKTYPLRIDLQATSNYFAPGHRIRLQVSSSNFPRFARNLNTGGNDQTGTEWVKARNTVHHSRMHASHLLLPVAAGSYREAQASAGSR
jgi:putative CocE/NonD family hydrolase